jgi:hypothetical protein
MTPDRPHEPGPPEHPGCEPRPSEPRAGDASPATVAAHHAKGRARPADTIWRVNPREQGLIGLTDAMHWFASHGYAIALPLIDAQPYDLIVESGTGLERVQVKTTTYRSPRGIFTVSLCTTGGNQSFTTTRLFDPTTSELLYVLTDAGDRYVIPTRTIAARRTLNLGREVERYRR